MSEKLAVISIDVEMDEDIYNSMGEPEREELASRVVGQVEEFLAVSADTLNDQMEDQGVTVSMFSTRM